jgi:hypothetical protein
VRTLTGKLEGKRAIGRPRHKWHNIKTYMNETDCKSMHWIDLAQDNDKWHDLVNMVINFWVPYNVVNFLTN